MDNYLLSGHILVCKIVPDDEIHPKLWIGANRKFRPVPKGRRDRIRREAVSFCLTLTSMAYTPHNYTDIFSLPPSLFTA